MLLSTLIFDLARNARGNLVSQRPTFATILSLSIGLALKAA